MGELKIIDIDDSNALLVAYLRNPAIYRYRTNRMKIRNRAADSLEALNKVHKAVVQYKTDFDSMSVEAEYESRSALFDALAEYETNAPE